jgi:hypothetical protein
VSRPGAEYELRASVLLSLQRALLGAVGPNLRAVAVGWDERGLEFVCFVEREVTADDEDEMGTVCAEVAADFAPPFAVDFRVLRLDAPEKPAAPDGWPYQHFTFVFVRSEESP